MSDELQKSLETAWDEVESRDEEDLNEPEQGEVSDAEPEPGHSAEASGTEPDDAAGEVEGDEELQPVPAEAEGSGQEGQETPDSGEKPPVGLGAAAREVWKDTPKAVRDEMAKREADYAKGIQKYAEDAKRADGMDKALAPFQPLFSMNGGPGQVLPGLLQTATSLQMGNPQQQAQTVANIIQQFGVDIRILDDFLSGSAPNPASPSEAPPQQDISQVVRQIMQEEDNARTQTQVQSEIEQFAADPKNEFYTDVREDMAYLMDMSYNRGQEMSIQEAYEKACQLNPQISQILSSRQMQQTSHRKRLASSSVSGTLGDAATPPPARDMRSAISQAWSDLENR